MLLEGLADALLLRGIVCMLQHLDTHGLGGWEGAHQPFKGLQQQAVAPSTQSLPLSQLPEQPCPPHAHVVLRIGLVDVIQMLGQGRSPRRGGAVPCLQFDAGLQVGKERGALRLEELEHLERGGG